MKQESFSDMEYRCRKKKTKREEFLEIMDKIIPWDEWVYLREAETQCCGLCGPLSRGTVLPLETS